MADTPQNYLLRDIPPDVWGRFKSRAEAEGIPMREILLAMADAFGNGVIDVGAQPLRPATTAKRVKR